VVDNHAFSYIDHIRGDHGRCMETTMHSTMYGTVPCTKPLEDIVRVGFFSPVGRENRRDPDTRPHAHAQTTQTGTNTNERKTQQNRPGRCRSVIDHSM
jgi:hypothetical protein